MSTNGEEIHIEILNDLYASVWYSVYHTTWDKIRCSVYDTTDSEIHSFLHRVIINSTVGVLNYLVDDSLNECEW